MSADLILYSNPMSRGRIARWMLEEVGQPYTVEYLDYGKMKGADYCAINPMGKVPALKHGAAIVTEGAAICAYLAAAFPAAGLMPEAGTPASADYFRWLFFGAGPVEAAVTNNSLGFVAPPEKKGMVGYGSYEETIDALERAVADREFIAGDAFSAADVYTGSQIGFGLTFGSIKPRPSFTEYWARMSARAAHQRAAELDNAAIPPKE